MGRLIIDGNSVFEIDEECVKNRSLPKSCDILKYLNMNIDYENKQGKSNFNNQDDIKKGRL